jgi:hypothetical protein
VRQPADALGWHISRNAQRQARGRAVQAVRERGLLDTGAEHANKPTLGNARIDCIHTRGVTTTSGSVLSATAYHRPIVMKMTR